MAQSLFDYGAKSRGQRTRLKSIFEPPTPADDDEDEKEDLSLWTGGDNLDMADRGKQRGGLAAYDTMGGWLGAMMGAPGVLGPQMAIDGIMGRGLFGKNVYDAQAQLTTDEAMGGMTQAGKDASRAGGGYAKGGMADDLAAFSGDPNSAAVSPGGGWGAGGMADDMAAFGGGVPDLAGLYAEGGKVGPQSLFAGDPPGPDNVIIGAKTGERVLTEAQYASLSPECKAEIDAALKPKAKRK